MTTKILPAGFKAWEDLPVWYRAGCNDIGMKERGNNDGPYVAQIIAQSHCGHIHDPWCAIAVNAWLERNGIRGTRSASSQSFRSDPNFVKLAKPAIGAIAVFWRGTPKSGLGHVGLYDGETATRIQLVSGNAGDMVKRSSFARSSATFGLVGYWWPKSIPLPSLGAVAPTKGASGAVGKVT